MKKLFFLFFSMIFSTCALAQSSSNPVISTTTVVVRAIGNPAHLQTSVDAQFATALTSVVGNSSATTSITSAKTTADTAIVSATAASAYVIMVNYSWTITTKLDGTITVTPSQGNSIGVHILPATP